jgi:hypothetical protein
MERQVMKNDIDSLFKFHWNYYELWLLVWFLAAWFLHAGFLLTVLGFVTWVGGYFAGHKAGYQTGIQNPITEKEWQEWVDNP